MRFGQIHPPILRCFEDYTFEPHPAATALAGTNGAGKSTVLDALHPAPEWSLSG
ncbi:MAG: hypothetical protein AMXMBFR64_20450 [Myxococcales bacterium]